MKKRGLVTALLVATMALATTFTSLAGEWKQDTTGWWYQEDDGHYPKSSEVWIDGNNDGMAECYYFDEAGYLVTTPFQEDIEFLGMKLTDLYTMNADGALMVDGAVQSRPTQLNSTIGQYSFVNETIKDIVNKDVAYVDSILGESGTVYYANSVEEIISGDVAYADSVLGKSSEDYSMHSSGGYWKSYQNRRYLVLFIADRCVEIHCSSASNMFNFTKDNYSTLDIALELGLEVDKYGSCYLTNSQDIKERFFMRDGESAYLLRNAKTYYISESINN